MATVTSVAASPTTVTPHGGVSTITPALVNNPQTLTVTVTADDGSTGSGTITINAETLTFSVDPTKIVSGKAEPGFVVATVTPSTLGTLTVAASGTAFTFTAS